MNILRRCLNGMALPFHAWGELKRIRGRRFIVLPIVINIVFAALLFRYGLTTLIVHTVLPYIDGAFNDRWQWIVSVLEVLLDLLALLLVTFMAVRLGTIIGSPFYGMIAERIDADIVADTATPTMNVFQSIGSAVWFELRKMTVFVGCALLGVALEFIPVAGPLIGTGWFVALGGVMALLDYTDVSLSRRHMAFRQRFGLFLRRFPEVFGFACVAVPLAGIPVVNMATVPLCICAGVLLYGRYLHPQTTP